MSDFNFTPEKCFVAFIDVLGFKELLKSGERIEDYYRSTNTILNEFRGIDDKKGIKSLIVSDSIILAMPFTQNCSALREFLVAIAKIQKELVLKKIWTRGAVAVGDFQLYENKNNQFAVGNGLAQAYLLETKFAKFPRVIIDPKLFHEMGVSRGDLKKKLKDQKSQLSNPLFDPMDHDDDSTFIAGSPMISDAVWVNFVELLLKTKDELSDYLNNLKNAMYIGADTFEKFKWLQGYTQSIYHSDINMITFKANEHDEFSAILNDM